MVNISVSFFVIVIVIAVVIIATILLTTVVRIGGCVGSFRPLFKFKVLGEHINNKQEASQQEGIPKGLCDVVSSLVT
jgi:hypothetical protein